MTQRPGSVIRATMLMLLWWIVVYGSGSRPEFRFQPWWFPHLGVVITNALGVVAVGFAAWGMGSVGPERHDGWRRAGLVWGDWSRYRLLVPLLACSSLSLVISRTGFT